MRVFAPIFLAALLIVFSSGCGQRADVTSPKGAGPERTGHRPGGSPPEEVGTTGTGGGYAATTSSTTGMGAPGAGGG
jgi:hypothetical protein